MVSIWLCFWVFGQECLIFCSLLMGCQLAIREDSLLNPPPQQNLWVDSGSGSRPSV